MFSDIPIDDLHGVLLFWRLDNEKRTERDDACETRGDE